MKNNFLSLVTKMPQNTGGGNSQTKRATLALPLRYLCAMLLALFMGIGNVWGATFAPENNPATKKYGDITFLDVANTKANGKITADGATFKGDSTLAYSLRYVGQTLAITTWYNCTDNPAGDFESSPTYADAEINGFVAPSSTSGNIGYGGAKAHSGRIRYFYATGITSVAIISHDKDASKYVQLKIEEVAANGDLSAVTTINSPEKSSSTLSLIEYTTALSPTKYYKISCTSNNSSNCKVYQIRFGKYIAPSCAAGAPGNISKGTLSAGVLTLNAAGSAVSGDTWYWQSSATGTDKTNSGSSYNVSVAGTYYIRSYNVAGDCWSDAKSFEVKATDLVANYTVIYKDGETTLKSVNVAVGSAPDAYSPTKDFYTFAAWQKDAADFDPATLASTATSGQTYTLSARWTANYAFGAYSFVNVAEVGTAPNKLTMTDGTTVNVPAGSRVDNFYFSAMAIKYESGASTVLTDYKGWKINTKDATIRFLVENNSQVKIALGRDNTAAVSYTALNGTVNNNVEQAKSTEVAYSVKAGTVFTLSMTTGSTITLKRITISDLYNATYSTSKSSVDPTSASDVAEVTLPTPAATTVDGYNFTGWKADQIVKVAGVEKAVGTEITAGTVVELTATTAFTAQWQLISDFDVKFFRGYGDPDVQIGETQSISTGGHAVAPADPTRTGFAFLGWSYDATEAHIVDVATYGITAATNFTAMWKAVWTVTFDGAGNVEVQDGETVASPNSPVMAGKVFQGWYNAEVKYDFSATVTSNLALTSKWADADPNHFYYTYNDDFHFDGVVYKTPDGKTTDPEAAEASNVALATNPYTLFSGASGITSIVATKGIYDYKKGAGTKHITAYLKLKADDATSNVVFTIASGYTAVLKLKMNGYSSNATISLKKGDDAVTPSGTQEGTAEGKNYGELTYSLTAGEYKLTTANKTLYISHIDLEATALPAHTVTYKPGDGEGAWVVDDDATEVADCPGTFTAPTGKVFNGWKNESDDSDVAVGAIVEDDMNLIAQWINHYAVTFNMNGHGDAIDPQDIKEGAKATRPDDPIAIGFDFGGWFTDNGTFEVPFDFNTSITAATPLYAKWTAFDGCTLLVPATTGATTIYEGDEIDMQTGSKGATVFAVTSTGVVGTETTLHYNQHGLSFEQNGGTARVKVTLDHELAVGSKISLKLMANGNSGSNRALDLYKNTTKVTSIGWKNTDEYEKFDVETFTYTVTNEDGLAGEYEFYLYRNNSVILEKLTIESCGDAITFHNLTSEIAPDHDPAYATVTLGASSVREGYTTTATYSDIDAAYEFDEWQISGTGASIADASANPAVITMGTADAVVTLKLKVATPKHTVTFNKMGKGADIAPALVAEGAKVTEPTVTEPEGWMLEGWYKESTLENKWDFATDVMGNTDIELFANWVADTSIKLINKSTGAINTTNFTTAVAAEADVDGEKGAVFNANRDAISSVSALNEMVQYNATTTQTKIQLVMYNTSSNPKTIYLFKVAEGDDAATLIDITIDGNSRKTTEYYTFNSDKNRSFYITVSDKKVQILQMRVVESGTALKQFGQAGYSLNLNKGRIFAKNDGSAYPFEGGSIKVSSDYKVLNNSNLATKSYIQFNNAVAGTILKVTRSGGNYYVSQDPEEKGTIYNANAEVELTATGTWYLGSQTSGSAASFTKIEFIAPKCAEPQFNALANSDICSGDPYVALDGTATVADAGVPTYKWYAEGADESDPAAVLATTATYTPSADGNYYVIATNHLGGYTDNTKKSDLVSVTTHSGTAITEGLAHVRKTAGVAATLTVEATGKNLHYAWKESETIDGTYTDVAGATDSKSLEVVVPDGAKYYKVIVSSDCGANQESIAKVEKFVPVAQVVVDNSVVWDLTTCADAQIQLKSTTSPKKGEECLMANIEGVHMDDNFHSESLVMSGEYIYRNVTGKPTCAEYMKFETSVAGLVRVHFAGNGENRCLRITSSDNVQYSSVSTGTGNDLTEEFEVAAGVIELMGMDSEHTSDKRYMRFYQIEFYAYDTERADSWIAPGELGTICYPNGHVFTGAEVYEMAGVDENNKFVFDQVEQTEPGKPYLFVATSYEPIKLYKTTAAAELSPIAHKGMIGTFVSIDLDYTDERAAKWYYFSGKKFYAVSKRTSDLNVPANRAYVDMNTPVLAGAPKHGVRRITFDVQGTNIATGVENAAATDKPAKMLINGQLFILRGEKMYDAKGQLVK